MCSMLGDQQETAPSQLTASLELDDSRCWSDSSLDDNGGAQRQVARLSKYSGRDDNNASGQASLDQVYVTHMVASTSLQPEAF